MFALVSTTQSSLSRGTWIEISVIQKACASCWCRPSHEGRGLKCQFRKDSTYCTCRPSHEGRGLKSVLFDEPCRVIWSSLSRGTWIEIKSSCTTCRISSASSLSRGTWIEILWIIVHQSSSMRRPSHEGRGLKSADKLTHHGANGRRPSHEGRGLKYPSFCASVQSTNVVPLTRDVD